MSQEQVQPVEETLQLLVEDSPQPISIQVGVGIKQPSMQRKQQEQIHDEILNVLKGETKTAEQQKGQHIQVKVNIAIAQIIPIGQQLKSLQTNIQEQVAIAMNLPVTFQNEHNEDKAKQQKRYNVAKKTQPKIISPQLQSLENNKLIKQIFTHFCKENYISSIKSTLFEDKQKMMQEMNLNKWMVFCKEFDIFSKLCNMKIQQRNKSFEQTKTVPLQKQSSRVRQIKVKQIKQVQKILSQIFKKSAENHTKMLFRHFIEGIELLRQEFNDQNEPNKLSSAQFAKKHLFCQTSDICFKKLANLKFTFGIPQIDYAKSISTPSQRNTQKSKLTIIEQKQNHDDQISQASKKTPKIHLTDVKTMRLNPIIKEAKNTLSTLDNKSAISTIRKHPVKNINLNQPIKQKKKVQKVNQKNELFKYFDETQDQILQSYFNSEKLNTTQKTK